MNAQRGGSMTNQFTAFGLVLRQVVQETMTEPEFRQTLPPGTVYFKILGSTGHERLVWSKLIPEQLKEAQAKFYELIDKGYKMFAVGADGKQTDRKIIRFDPDAEELIAVQEIIAVAPMSGG
jgi:hypothetical protein